MKAGGDESRESYWLSPISSPRASVSQNRLRVDERKFEYKNLLAKYNFFTVCIRKSFEIYD